MPAVTCHAIDRFYALEVGDDCPFYVAAAVLHSDPWGRRRVVSGRGLTAQCAKDRCVHEAIERQSAVFRGATKMLHASALELAEKSIAVQTLLQISNAQYETLSVWNARVEDDHHLPQPFNRTQKISWTSARSLNTHEMKFVPSAHCYLGYPNALLEGFPVPDSSGLACGETMDDAIVRGVHELVERDAVALWWYNRLQKPLLKFDADALPLWLPFSNWISRCGRLFWLLDLTADLPGTVTVAISCDHNGQDVSFGFGAAQTPEAAAENAIGELVQFEVTKRHSKNNGKPNLMTWAKTADVKNYPFLKPSDIAPKIAEKKHDRCGSIVEELKKQGLEGFFIDITLPEQHVKAVRVIIPGLRQIWPRFAPGRLYDVPHRLGWLDRPLTEIELNPVPLLY